MKQSNPDASRSLLNWITSMWSGSEIIHAELFFHSKNMTFTITHKRPAEMTYMRSFDREGWDFVKFYVTDDQYHKVYRYCSRKSGILFDKVGILASIMGSYGNMFMDRNSGFCTKLITNALVYGGVLESKYKEIAMTPHDLRQCIMKDLDGFSMRDPYQDEG